MASGGLIALGWVAFKVGALAYGGGFVIVPLMQAEAVGHYHWMSSAQFLNAVALGQITPGPLVQTVAVVGYAAAGVGGGLLAAAVAFAPSFSFILLGARRFDRLRADARQAFLDGAGPAAVGAIIGSAIRSRSPCTRLGRSACSPAQHSRCSSSDEASSACCSLPARSARSSALLERRCHEGATLPQRHPGAQAVSAVFPPSWQGKARMLSL
jgi:chromate transport protein ChrA